ncbi:MAG: CheB methylesterase [Labilithrix sp.]|nr:CheB methylesterase [Labilithrix sp.]
MSEQGSAGDGDAKRGLRFPSGHVVVVGASAGGVEALRELTSRLPPDLDASVLVALHVPSSSRSLLPAILQRHTKLAVRHAVDGEPLVPGTILVAPPDLHLLVHGGNVRLSHGARENGHRPAIDPMFRSAARWFGDRAVGVILSGALDDGTSGMLAVRLGRGTTIAQWPEEAAVPSMPLSAIREVGVDYVAPVAEIAEIIARLSREKASATATAKPPLAEAPLEDDDMMTQPEVAPQGAPSTFTCPECHGALWELRDGKLVRFRCRIGHAFAPDSLMSYQQEHVEEAMWTALRALEETAALATQLAHRAKTSGFPDLAVRYDERRQDAEKRAETIRKVVEMFGGRAAE